ncbi:MAG: hypothetical protein AB1556_13655 [Bacillota bacterium]
MLVLLTMTVFLLTGPASAYVVPVFAQRIDQQRPVLTALELKLEEVRRNRHRLQNLNAATTEKMAVLKRKITGLRHNPEELTPQQLTVLKDETASLARQRKIMAATEGLIRRNSIALRKHLQSRDYQAALHDLDRIIAVQRIRIQSLQAVSPILDRLIAAIP